MLAFLTRACIITTLTQRTRTKKEPKKSQKMLARLILLCYNGFLIEKELYEFIRNPKSSEDPRRRYHC